VVDSVLLWQDIRDLWVRALLGAFPFEFLDGLVDVPIVGLLADNLLLCFLVCLEHCLFKRLVLIGPPQSFLGVLVVLTLQLFHVYLSDLVVLVVVQVA